MEILSAKAGVRARPGLKASQAIYDFLGCTVKINLAVFLLKDGRQRGFGMILWLRMNRSRLQSAQGFHHEVGADRGHARRQSYGCVLRRYRNFLPQQNVSGIEAGIDSHGGDAGHALAPGNGPLDRRCSAIFGQQRSVQIEISQPRQINHPLRNDAPISDHDDGVRRDSRKLPAKFFVVLDLVRLTELQSQLQCPLLDRRKCKFHAAAFRPVRLRHHQGHRESGFHQLFQSGHGERRCAAENEIERRRHRTSAVGPQTTA